jgi:hypothetical protein
MAQDAPHSSDALWRIPGARLREPASAVQRAVYVEASSAAPAPGSGSRLRLVGHQQSESIPPAAVASEPALFPAAGGDTEPHHAVPGSAEPREITPYYAPLADPPPELRSVLRSHQPPAVAPPIVPTPISDDEPLGGCPPREQLIQRLDQITLDLRYPAGRTPVECPLWPSAYLPRQWCPRVFMWKASALCHKPLYFEEVALERYGHSKGHFVQPFVSGAHFFATIPMLPYKMGLEHPEECIYALGYYRPGSCAPKMLYPLPLSLRGAAYQGAAITGLVFVLP